MEIGDKIELTVEKIAFGGEGLARVNGEVIFLRDAVPGEKVIVEVTKVKNNFSRGKILRCAADSPDRVVPACPMARRCPGCALAHLSYDAENRVKNEMMHDLLRGVAAADTEFAPFDGASPEFGYRNKIQFHAHRVTGGMDIGFIGRDNVTALDVPHCLLANGPINDEIARLRTDKGFYHSLHDGMKLTFRNSDSGGVLFYRNNPPRGLSWLRENLSIGEFSVPAESFFQVNRHGCESLISCLLEVCRNGKFARLVDLYCGAGLFSSAVARAGLVDEVVGIEMDPAAIEAARYNLRNAGGVKSHFVAGDVLKCVAEATAGHAAETLLVVDPPRTGLERGVPRLIGASEIRHMVYISCEPSTFARDVAALGNSGFALRSVKGINMFPRTGHFELFSVLERA